MLGIIINYVSFKIWLILFVIIILVGVVFFGKNLFIKNQPANLENNQSQQKNMKIESDVFVNNGNIPKEYTCNGAGTQIPLKISGAPKEAKSLVLVVDDPDVPSGDFVHWVVWNIDPQTSAIGDVSLPTGAVEGNTSLNKSGWVAPCPPSGTHHYNFKLYALACCPSNTKVVKQRRSSPRDGWTYY